MNTSEAIKRLRGGESQQAFSTRLGISMRAIQHYERSENPRTPEPRILSALMEEARKQGRKDLAKLFSDEFIRQIEPEDEIRKFIQLLFGTARPVQPVTPQQRASVGAILHSIWNHAGKAKPTKADVAEIRRLASEAHEIVEGMRIEDIPGDWNK